MLMCPECHKYIDNEGAKKYDIQSLLKMKKDHEDRIMMLTDINPNSKSLVVLYGANVGFDTPTFCKNEIFLTIAPNYYPANAPVSIELKNSSFYDSRDLFWRIEHDQLISKCKNDILPKIYNGDVSHVSLFAIAPQPLLVKLGSLLNDKYNVDVYQKHREPYSWSWQPHIKDNPFKVLVPEVQTNDPILVFALSSDTIIERIKKRFDDESIWIVTCEQPNNDMLISKTQLKEFRTIVRNLINTIETQSAADSLKIFMAMPASLAVEFGRIRMEKANMKWILHDYNREINEDFETITISNNQ